MEHNLSDLLLERLYALRETYVVKEDEDAVVLLDNVIDPVTHLPEFDNPKNVIHAGRSIIQTTLNIESQTGVDVSVLLEALTIVNSLRGCI